MEVAFVLLTIVISSYAHDPVCNQTPFDQGDPESIQVAQLNAIRCQITVLERNHAASINAIQNVHNETQRSFSKILDTILKLKPRTSILSIIGYCVISIVSMYLLKSLSAVLWYSLVQRSDRLAEYLMLLSNLRARWWNSASPVYSTVDHYRDSFPVPILLVIIRCCRCSKQPDTDCELESR